MLTPVDGLSLSVPAHWMACDEASNAKLASAPDRRALAPKFCGTQNATSFGAFDPEPLHPAAIYAGREPQNAITEGVILRMSEANLVTMGQNVCPVLEKPFVDAHAVIASCVLKREAIAGHPALVFRIVSAPSEEPAAQSELEAWAIATPRGVVDFNVVWPVYAKDKVQPMLQAIRDSLQLQ